MRLCTTNRSLGRVAIRNRIPRATIATALTLLLGAQLIPAIDAGDSSGTTAATASVVIPSCGHAEPGHASCTLELPSTASPASATASPASLTMSQISGLKPDDIASAYGLSGGVSGTVGVVDAYDNPNLESDLAVYRSTMGLPACTTANGCFRKVSQRGNTTDLPAANADWGKETSLDVDAVSAACPACSILVVETDDTTISSLGTGVNMAVALGAAAVSNSWGGAESENAAYYSSTYFTHPGVPILAASGDSSYPEANMPATLPNVIAVGGTSLTRTTAPASTVDSSGAAASSGSGVAPAVATTKLKATALDRAAAKVRITTAALKKATATVKRLAKQRHRTAAQNRALAKARASVKTLTKQVKQAKAVAKAAAAAASKKKAASKAPKTVVKLPVTITKPTPAPVAPAPVATPTPPVATPTPSQTATQAPTTTDRGWTETVWSGAGSGCSTRVAKPAWQTDQLCTGRTVADVAAVANPATGLAIYDTYGTSSLTSTGWFRAGGTSLSTPLVAAMVVRSGHAANYSNASPLYANASAFWDVTSGSNGSCSNTAICTGTSGYDGPTGLGTPKSLASF